MKIIVQATHHQNVTKRDLCFTLNRKQTHAHLYTNVNTIVFIAGFLFYFYGSFFENIEFSFANSLLQ